MKRQFFWSVFFYVFVRRQIYDAIAAIFWQSASNVYINWRPNILTVKLVLICSCVYFGVFAEIYNAFQIWSNFLYESP